VTILPEKKNNNSKSIIIFIFYFILALLTYMLISNMLNPNNVEKVNYTRFYELIEKNEIMNILIEDNGDIKFKTKEGLSYSVYAPAILFSPQTIDEFIARGIKVSFEQGLSSNWWASLLGYMLPILLLIFIWIFVLRILGKRGNGAQGMSFAKNKAKVYDPQKNKISFKDVAGIDECIEELQDIVSYLKEPEKYTSLGAKIPRGVLLVGSPGTGKTLVARAVAGEAEVPFYYISGSDFVELFVGVGASRVRDLFIQAKTNPSAIIFIDEIDAVGRQRGAGLGGGNDEREQTLNQLLVEMDGFESNTGIIVMAATNRPDILDKALLRPGRFDKKIHIDIPDLKGREEILKIHLKGKKMSPNLDLKKLAQGTPGFTGADLENLLNEAALVALRGKKELIETEDCEEAIERVLVGPERKSRLISEKERKILAYHELGHAFVGHILPNMDPVHKVTIVPRGHSALGYTLQIPEEDKFLVSKSEYLNNIKVLLAGRACEEVVFGEITTGASNDIKRATENAKKMILHLGMSEKIGPVLWGEEEEVFLGRDMAKPKNFSEETAKELDIEIKKIIISCYSESKKLIKDHLDKIHLVSKYILKHETISGKDLEKMIDMDLVQLESYVFDKTTD